MHQTITRQKSTSLPINRTRAAWLALALFLSLALTLPLSAQSEAERVYQRMNPSVVSISHAEGFGTGMIIEDSGLILTNRHVIETPFPLKVQIDLVASDGSLKSETFKGKTIAVHPKYDLALVQVDPAEHKEAGELKSCVLSQKDVNPGQAVYVIGNPGLGQQALNKSITSGLVSAANRIVEGLPYHQVDAAINPGNSGGPLCNGAGEVIGVVTFKGLGVDNIGFAIPVKGFNKASFAKPEEVMKIEPAKVEEILAGCDQLMEQAEEISALFGHTDPRAMQMRAMALQGYRMVFVAKPETPLIKYRMGAASRSLGKYQAALKYLTDAITASPWADEAANTYRELGLTLYQMDRKDEATVAYNEGLAKHPGRAGKIWGDLARQMMEKKDYWEAAWNARAAVVTGIPTTEPMEKLYNDAKQHFDAGKKVRLELEMQKLQATLFDKQAEADKHRQSKEPFVNSTFATLLEKLAAETKNLDVTADEEAGEDDVDMTDIWDDKDKAEDKVAKGDEPVAGEDDKMTDADAAEVPAVSAAPVGEPKAEAKDKEPELDGQSKWIRDKIELAKLYQRSKLRDKAIETLQTIIDTYPDDPQTEEARALLKRWG